MGKKMWFPDGRSKLAREAGLNKAILSKGKKKSKKKDSGGGLGIIIWIILGIVILAAVSGD